MTIAISFDPTHADDVAWVQNILSTPEEAAAPAAKPRGKAAAKPAPEPEPEEDTAEEGVTLEQCVEKAQELVGEGRTAEVKGVLANFGVKRVSELDEDKYADFLQGLEDLGEGV